MKVYILMRSPKWDTVCDRDYADLIDVYLCPKEARRIAKWKTLQSSVYEFFVKTKTVKGGV